MREQAEKQGLPVALAVPSMPSHTRCSVHAPPPPLPPGRKGKTGIATTFINKNQSEQILLDLKHLLKASAWLPGWWRDGGWGAFSRLRLVALQLGQLCEGAMQLHERPAQLANHQRRLPLATRRKRSSACRQCCRRCTTRWRSWR